MLPWTIVVPVATDVPLHSTSSDLLLEAALAPSALPAITTAAPATTAPNFIELLRMSPPCSRTLIGVHEDTVET
ncbi:hypothetical protein GCM10027215_39820 [Nocardioides zeae]